MKWTVRTENSGNPLTDLHETAFDTVSDLYEHQDPHETRTYESRADELASLFSQSHRDALADALTAYMQRIGGSAASMKQIDKLRSKDAVAVITGQQAGLFVGPMYSLYKAMSAIGMASRLETELGRSVVPVFWIASEDHDWGEVDHAYLLDQDDELRRVRLQQDVPLHQMVYYVQVDEKAALQVITVAREWLPEGQEKEELLQFLSEAWTPGISMADWFAKIMVRLTGPFGLVLVDPCLPELRALVADVWQHVLLGQDVLERELSAAYQSIEARGFEPGVIRDARNTTMFYVEKGKRYVMERDVDDMIRVRVLGIRKTAQEWAQLASEQPSAFSANVLLRPVVQDFLLPTLAYLGGPSEVAYHALARGVFRALERPMPPVVLRDRVTIYPPSVIRNMKKWNISMEQVQENSDVIKPALRRLGVSEIDHVFSGLREETEYRWLEWTARFDLLGPQITDMAKAQIQREIDGLRRLEQKTRRLFLDRHEVELRQLRNIQRWLWTDGHAQERRLSPISFWARYGMAWIGELRFWGDYTARNQVYHVEL